MRDLSRRLFYARQLTGVVTTIAGNGFARHFGDGGAATAAELNQPAEIAVDSSGDVFIADTANARIRKVNTSGTFIRAQYHE
jgi:hypothetical protein